MFALSLTSRGQIVSNLGESADFFPFVGTTVWRATSFTTDSQAYTLDSVTLSLGVNMPGGTVTPRVFADASGSPSDSPLETFTSQTVNTAGNYTFNSTGLSLASDTTYWLALQGSAQNPVWRSTPSQNQTGDWEIGNAMLTSTDSGATWPTTESFTGKFSVSATPVPEPEHYATGVALLLGGFAVWRRRCRSALRAG